MKNIFNQFLGIAVFSVSLLFSGSIYSLDDLGRKEGSVEYSIDSQEVAAVLKEVQELGTDFLQKAEGRNPGFNSNINRVVSYLENSESISREEMLSAVVNIMNVVQAEQLQQNIVQAEQLQQQLQQKDTEFSQELNKVMSLWGEDKVSLEGKIVHSESINKNLRIELENHTRSRWPGTIIWISVLVAILVIVYLLSISG